MKVLHVITDLGQGGAEAVLFRLVAASAAEISHVVISLKSDGYYGPRLRALGIEVQSLGKPQGGIGIKGVLKLRRLIAEAQPDVVQTWMYHGDLVGGLVARWAGVRAVVWGVRNSNLDADKVSFSARAAARICARLSTWIPASIVCCSVQATKVHQAIGYEEEVFTVIANGYDLSSFLPDSEARARLRTEWGITSEQVLLGMVARWDPHKDHDNLLRALAELKELGADFHCVLVGIDMDWHNIALASSIRRLNLDDRIILTGSRDDIPAVMNALDLHVLSSVGEAFPNTVAEAMACGTPCVVTDVGDAPLIVGDTGWVVPRQNPAALARGIAEALEVIAAKDSTELGQRCRKRIEQNFGLEKMLCAYRALWMKVSNVEAMS